MVLQWKAASGGMKEAQTKRPVQLLDDTPVITEQLMCSLMLWLQEHNSIFSISYNYFQDLYVFIYIYVYN